MKSRKKVIITGSSGLIGSETSLFFDDKGWEVHGIDNNMRKDFFGDDGDVISTLEYVQANTDNFVHHNIDIRDRGRILDLFEDIQPDYTIHCAAQPSHDLAADIPFKDFEINAGGTLNLLEATRRHCPESPFAYMSTNKVYGDAPNEIPLVELETRYDYKPAEYQDGIDESMRIDQSMHSLFGASKLAADILVQEYGQYFDIPTVCFRGGCLTGSQHAGAELHGFLSYLAKCVKKGKKYTIFGYKGKQVRDNIHAHDVARAFYVFVQNPRVAAVYNLGGGRGNSVSMLEAIDKLEEITGNTLDYEMSEEHRKGDHICYISDLTKFKEDYPDWDITISIDEILEKLGG